MLTICFAVLQIAVTFCTAASILLESGAFSTENRSAQCVFACNVSQIVLGTTMILIDITEFMNSYNSFI